VRLLYANASTKDDASEWIEMQLQKKDDDNRHLGAVHLGALLRVQAAIDAEMNRLRLLVGQTRG